MANRPEMKSWIASIHAYVPGKSTSADGRELVKLSANENPLGTSPLALEARARAAGPSTYPDPDSGRLRQAIGKLYDIAPERILCGTGSGELLSCAVQAYAGAGDEILFSRYSFSLYPLLAAKVGADAVMADDDDYAASVDQLLAKVSERTRVVLLDNPNNPIGTWLPADEVARLHAALPEDVLLVVDQAYAEYVAPGSDDGALALAAAHENVLVTRTFSKIYGLAGERVGWGTAAPHIVDALNRIRGPFNVTVSAQAAALAALEDQEWVVRSREHNIAERARFAAGIETLGNRGLRAVPSEANFLLVLFEGKLTAQEAHDGLAARGYATRHLPGQDLPNALRITIGTGDQMDDVIAALREMAGEAG